MEILFAKQPLLHSSKAAHLLPGAWDFFKEMISLVSQPSCLAFFSSQTLHNLGPFMGITCLLHAHHVFPPSPPLPFFLVLWLSIFWGQSTPLDDIFLFLGWSASLLNSSCCKYYCWANFEHPIQLFLPTEYLQVSIWTPPLRPASSLILSSSLSRHAEGWILSVSRSC